MMSYSAHHVVHSCAYYLSDLVTEQMSEQAREHKDRGFDSGSVRGLLFFGLVDKCNEACITLIAKK